MSEPVVLEEEFDENYEPTEDEIIEYAKFLGMNVNEDKDLFWIAKESLKAPLPKDWKPCQTDDGNIYYFNFSTGESIWDHPCDEHYKKLYEDEKAKRNAKRGSHKAEPKATPTVKEDDDLKLLELKPSSTPLTKDLPPLTIPTQKSSALSAIAKTEPKKESDYDYDVDDWDLSSANNESVDKVLGGLLKNEQLVGQSKDKHPGKDERDSIDFDLSTDDKEFELGLGEPRKPAEGGKTVRWEKSVVRAPSSDDFHLSETEDESEKEDEKPTAIPTGILRTTPATAATTPSTDALLLKLPTGDSSKPLPKLSNDTPSPISPVPKTRLRDVDVEVAERAEKAEYETAASQLRSKYAALLHATEQEEKDKYTVAQAKIRAEYDNKLEDFRRNQDQSVEKHRKEYKEKSDKLVETLQREHASMQTVMREQHQKALDSLSKTYDEEIRSLKQTHERREAQMKIEFDSKLDKLKEEYSKREKAENEANTKRLKKLQEDFQKLEKEEQAIFSKRVSEIKEASERNLRDLERSLGQRETEARSRVETASSRDVEEMRRANEEAKAEQTRWRERLEREKDDLKSLEVELRRLRQKIDQEQVDIEILRKSLITQREEVEIQKKEIASQRSDIEATRARQEDYSHIRDAERRVRELRRRVEAEVSGLVEGEMEARRQDDEEDHISEEFGRRVDEGEAENNPLLRSTALQEDDLRPFSPTRTHRSASTAAQLLAQIQRDTIGLTETQRALKQQREDIKQRRRTRVMTNRAASPTRKAFATIAMPSSARNLTQIEAELTKLLHTLRKSTHRISSSTPSPTYVYKPVESHRVPLYTRESSSPYSTASIRIPPAVQPSAHSLSSSTPYISLQRRRAWESGHSKSEALLAEHQAWLKGFRARYAATR
ncbi:hypothetical protein HDU85_000223 [Gaertneriomyces sp. JEL0708]|nr:hypothetical protein HDU85_000223 [Gaertneriomyces sp. JEL0708]